MSNTLQPFQNFKESLKLDKITKSFKCDIPISDRLFHVIVDKDEVEISLYRLTKQPERCTLISKQWFEEINSSRVFAYGALQNYKDKTIWESPLLDNEIKDIFKEFTRNYTV